MICKLLRTIELLDDLQYWLDQWTPFNAEKRYYNFDRIEHEFFRMEDDECSDIAGRARTMSIKMPRFSNGKYNGKYYGLAMPDGQSISNTVLAP